MKILPPKEDTGIRVKSTEYFRLKSKPGKHYQVINIEKQFGFVPEVIIFERSLHSNNEFAIRAVLTPSEIEKEDREFAKQAKMVKTKLKSKSLKLG